MSDLSARAEAIIYDYDPRDRDEGLEMIERQDLLLWSRAGPTKWTSSVRKTSWNESTAGAGIREVVSYFEERQRPFVWFVGPSSTPQDLSSRLERAGLVLEQRTRLLIAELPIHGLRINEEIRIVESWTREAVEARLRFAWPSWSEETIRSEATDRLRQKRLYGDRAGGLLAYFEEVPVADANWRDSTDGQTVYLTGAGTREAYRGRGIYQTLTAHRLQRAIRRGCTYAVIQSRMDTSMPILMRRGFRDVGEVSVFSWGPAAGAS